MTMNKIEKVLYGVCGLLLAWATASVIDVMCHNLSDNSYAIWNLFELLF